MYYFFSPILGLPQRKMVHVIQRVWKGEVKNSDCHPLVQNAISLISYGDMDMELKFEWCDFFLILVLPR